MSIVLDEKLKGRLHELMLGRGTVYHLSHNDLDGITPIILSERVFPEVKNRMIGNPDDAFAAAQEMLLTMADEDLFVVTDLPLDAATVDLIDASDKTVLYFDHHQGTLWVNAYPWADVRDVADGEKTCAASLYLEFLYDEAELFEGKQRTIHGFVEDVRLWDTWDWKKRGLNEPKRLNSLYYTIGANEFMDYAVARFDNGESHVTGHYQSMMMAEERRIEGECRKREKLTREYTNAYWTFGVVHGEDAISEVANHIVDQHPHLDFVVVVNLSRNTLSIRSAEGKTNVFELVQPFGGGGHPNAGGCTITQEVYDLFVRPYLSDVFGNIRL